MKDYTDNELTKTNVYLFSKFLNGRETKETSLKACVETALIEYEQYVKTLSVAV